MRLLVIEDDRKLSLALGEILREAGFSPDFAYDGEEGLVRSQSAAYDAIILDVMLPQRDGFSVAQELRRKNVSTPILLLTARNSVRDKITGLDSGADDYMTKPFSPAELLAHLRALLRRQGQVIFESLTFGDLSLNLESHDLTCRETSIHLGFKEFSLARILMSNPNQVITKEQLITKVWGVDSSAMDNNVEAYISFLRKKFRFLGSHVGIESLRKTGYRLVFEEAE